ncbi:MAG: DUF2461 domain-containing protein [Paramuribaculum sp.]|nr:DUF2461 domain-containing protein [Paramuribaculum sp.]
MGELYSFLEELSHNNNRPWFADHKAEYEELRAQWLADIDRMLAAMTAWEPALAGQTAKSCAYRFYRDTRFSSDKSPFKLFFSAAISPWGRKTYRAGYYIQTGIRGIGDNGLYAGIWCPEAPLLKKLRHAIVDNIEEFEQILTAPNLVESFPEWAGDTLKTIPKGWDRNHPCAELLRRKDFGRFHPCQPSFFMDKDWPIKAAELFRDIKPMVDFLNYSIDE